jgi:hypothetical protein
VCVRSFAWLRDERCDGLMVASDGGWLEATVVFYPNQRRKN